MVGTTTAQLRRWCRALFALIVGGLSTGLLTMTSVASETRSSKPEQCSVSPSGTLMICGGGKIPPEFVDRFFEFAGGKEARIVLVTTASIYATSPDIKERYSGWFERPHKSIEFYHARNRTEADDPHHSEMLSHATGLWFIGGNQNWVTETYLGTRSEEQFRAVLKRSGAIGGTSAGAAIMSRQMIAGGTSDPFLATGFGFIDGVIVDQHFRKRNRIGRLKRALELRPGHVGIGIDEATALIVRGRSLEVMGDSDVTFCLDPADKAQVQDFSLTAGGKEDLVRLSHAVISRAHFPPKDSNSLTPEIQSGTLVMVGNGSIPQEAVDEFLSAAGGSDAPIFVVSDSVESESSDEQLVCGWLKDAGAKNVHRLDSRTVADISESETWSQLKEARGVWFSGMHYSHLIESYLDTPMQILFQEVLQRGGVIGGKAAGAKIQGEFVVCHDDKAKLENDRFDGYERGFCFLPGVAIDEHFSQQDCLADITELKKAHPELVGIGIDEATALIVRGCTMQVVGKNSVAIMDRVPEPSQNGAEFEVLRAGQKYDFRQHKATDQAPLRLNAAK